MRTEFSPCKVWMMNDVRNLASVDYSITSNPEIITSQNERVFHEELINEGLGLADAWRSFVTEHLKELQRYHDYNGSDPRERHLANFARNSEGRTVGFMHFYETSAAGVWEMMGLAVAPACRGQEIGCALLRLALQTSIDQDAKYINARFTSKASHEGKLHILIREVSDKNRSVKMKVDTYSHTELLPRLLPTS